MPSETQGPDSLGDQDRLAQFKLLAQFEIRPPNTSGNDAYDYALELPSSNIYPDIVTRPGISPFLLSEIQTVILPMGFLPAALIAKIVYLDLFLRMPTPISSYLGASVLAAVVMFAIASQSGLHSATAIVEGQPLALAIVMTISLTFLILLGVFYLLDIYDQFLFGWFCSWYALSIVFLVLERFGILLWGRLLRAERRLLQRVAIFGSTKLAECVLEKLFAKDHNLVLTGVFSDDASARIRDKPVAGGMRELVASAQRGACDRVILALPQYETQQIRDAIAKLEVLPIHVQLSPDAMTIPRTVQGSQVIDDLVLLDLQLPPLNARGVLIKAVTDYLIGTALLILFTPVMLMIAAAIKLDSRGPVFFIQSRHGYNHRIIRVVKFRTMAVAEDGAEVTQAVRGDKRVTRVGRFLRRTSLDELPQLFNVMQGELSLVGPRPHAVVHNESYARILSNYSNRHKVKPGITGWAQINGARGETKTAEAMRQRVDFDLYYIKHWSLWLDLKILAKSVLVPFFGADAY
jgi:Undecaprenyl-phosphate glucose phosphotransferase